MTHPDPSFPTLHGRPDHGWINDPNGLAVIDADARFVDAFTFGQLMEVPDYQTVVIGIGAWLGTIMLFNVWGIIWPNQKKILGIKPATDEEKAKARKTALYASRTNFILSIPMLLCMSATSHGLPL